MLAMRALFQPASPAQVPDLIKVAGLARAFEPLIFYSENGAQQIGDLEATSIAVWDLGESVRSTNMTSAPIIVKQLDDLSDSLKTLAHELQRFFVNVDGDVDGHVLPPKSPTAILTTHQDLNSNGLVPSRTLPTPNLKPLNLHFRL